MSEDKDTPSFPISYTFQDGNSNVFVGVPADIIRQMKHIEWGDTPQPLEWKDRVRRRAHIFGLEMEFTDAFSFLKEMERHGLGRFIPDFVENRTFLDDLDTSDTK